MTALHRGQKVVCIRSYPPSFYRETMPVVNEIYTVRDIVTLFSYSFQKEIVCILLDEITNPVLQYVEGRMELPFFAATFRPLAPASTKIFREMCEATPTQPSAAPPLPNTPPARKRARELLTGCDGTLATGECVVSCQCDALEFSTADNYVVHDGGA